MWHWPLDLALSISNIGCTFKTINTVFDANEIHSISDQMFIFNSFSRFSYRTIYVTVFVAYNQRFSDCEHSFCACSETAGTFFDFFFFVSAFLCSKSIDGTGHHLEFYSACGTFTRYDVYSDDSLIAKCDDRFFSINFHTNNTFY